MRNMQLPSTPRPSLRSEVIKEIIWYCMLSALSKGTPFGAICGAIAGVIVVAFSYGIIGVIFGCICGALLGALVGAAISLINAFLVIALSLLVFYPLQEPQGYTRALRVVCVATTFLLLIGVKTPQYNPLIAFRDELSFFSSIIIIVSLLVAWWAIEDYTVWYRQNVPRSKHVRRTYIVQHSIWLLLCCLFLVLTVFVV